MIRLGLVPRGSGGDWGIETLSHFRAHLDMVDHLHGRQGLYTVLSIVFVTTRWECYCRTLQASPGVAGLISFCSALLPEELSRVVYSEIFWIGHRRLRVVLLPRQTGPRYSPLATDIAPLG